MQHEGYSDRYQERFWSKVDASGDCWEWIASIRPDGYGQVRAAGTTKRAHRVAYEILVGPIPDGLCLDHLCRNKACVNPDHVEPVTVGENVRRGKRAAIQRHQTHCKRGHEFTLENTVMLHGRRQCRTCSLRLHREYYARAKQRLIDATNAH